MVIYINSILQNFKTIQKLDRCFIERLRRATKHFLSTTSVREMKIFILYSVLQLLEDSFLIVKIECDLLTLN